MLKTQHNDKGAGVEHIKIVVCNSLKHNHKLHTDVPAAGAEHRCSKCLWSNPAQQVRTRYSASVVDSGWGRKQHFSGKSHGSGL